MVKELNNMEFDEIRKVLQRKDGIKMCIIPKKSKIQKDEYVGIKRIEKEVKK